MFQNINLTPNLPTLLSIGAGTLPGLFVGAWFTAKIATFIENRNLFGNPNHTPSFWARSAETSIIVLTASAFSYSVTFAISHIFSSRLSSTFSSAFILFATATPLIMGLVQIIYTSPKPPHSV